MSAIRAVIYGVGRLNCLATRLLREKGVEIVAAVNRAGPKVGRDLGEVAGLSESLGVVITDAPEQALSVPADIVMVAVHDDMERMSAIFEQCLANGLNVLSVGAHHSYPWRVAPKLTARLDAVAKSNGVTLSASGNQDFFMINLPAMMSGTCHRIDTIHHRSLSNVDSFGAEVADIAHVGLTLDAFAEQTRQPRPSVYTTFWENLAAALDLKVLDITQIDEPVVVTKSRFCRALAREIKAGKVIGTRTTLTIETEQGLSMRGDYELRICEHKEQEFKAWEIVGEPGLSVKCTDLDTGFLTTSQYVNRIAHVIQAPPGFVTLEQLPKLVYQARLDI